MKLLAQPPEAASDQRFESAPGARGNGARADAQESYLAVVSHRGALSSSGRSVLVCEGQC
eukprot:CAMPEP_0167824818 /NCGR_PEP_ID=MMETSP0112_2-20121227/9015_1 /TAXON_ID=91324 /ORGANISM="Lotharella globosa, Strain CCCM811" /LENGTH=59 /DNA_ID=CAMNT_0007726843 /DNA_START=82 /DNA_END=261 /DNA_ORIENTATION=+